MINCKSFSFFCKFPW